MDENESEGLGKKGGKTRERERWRERKKYIYKERGRDRERHGEREREGKRKKTARDGPDVTVMQSTRLCVFLSSHYALSIN